MKNMKLFLDFLWKKKGTILVFLLAQGLQTGIAALFALPLTASLYAGALGLLIGTAALLLDFLRQRRICQQLSAFPAAADSAGVLLPAPATLAEAGYRQVVQRLCEEIRQQAQGADRRYRDMMDYYTVWVHQIKTPIAAMDLTLGAQDSQLSRQLSAELNRVSQYVDMVLMYLRLDSDAMDFHIRQQALDPILRQALRRFAGEFISRKLKLVYEPLNVRVVTDEKWLCFVVEQLLSNALKYTPEGFVRIYLEAPATLCIQDTGIGIDPGDLPRIFERGYTGGNGRSHRCASGIGLFLCREICRKLECGIWAESAPDLGTTIRIDLYKKPLEVE